MIHCGNAELSCVSAGLSRLGIVVAFSTILPTLYYFTSSLHCSVPCQLGPGSILVDIHCV